MKFDKKGNISSNLYVFSGTLIKFAWKLKAFFFTFSMKWLMLTVEESIEQ